MVVDLTASDCLVYHLEFMLQSRELGFLGYNQIYVLEGVFFLFFKSMRVKFAYMYDAHLSGR